MSKLMNARQYEDSLTTKSHITGKKINRFTHIHQNVDDLVKKSKMGRLMGSLTACCFQPKTLPLPR